jgi:hypothetical protein
MLPNPMPPNASASPDAPEAPVGNTPDSMASQPEPGGGVPVRFVPVPGDTHTHALRRWPLYRLATEVQALRAVLKPLPSAPPPRDASS